MAAWYYYVPEFHAERARCYTGCLIYKHYTYARYDSREENSVEIKKFKLIKLNIYIINIRAANTHKSPNGTESLDDFCFCAFVCLFGCLIKSIK